MAKKIPEYYDILGRELAVGDCVVVDEHVWKIAKFNAKTMSVSPLNKRPGYKMRGRVKYKYYYGTQVAKVPEEEVMMWILKNPGAG
jgi:hypothetical protein